jgi:hypothetical protein
MKSKLVSAPEPEDLIEVTKTGNGSELSANSRVLKELAITSVNEVDASVEIGTSSRQTELNSDETQRYEIYGRSISELDGTIVNKR